jgi:hypothetical protein
MFNYRIVFTHSLQMMSISTSYIFITFFLHEYKFPDVKEAFQRYIELVGNVLKHCMNHKHHIIIISINEVN